MSEVSTVYVPHTRCNQIQWVTVHLRDGKPACPKCGAEAELILGFIGNPCYAHRVVNGRVVTRADDTGDVPPSEPPILRRKRRERIDNESGS